MIAPALTLSGSAWIGETHVFGPLSLTVEAGRWTCLLGPSGIGKSTLLRLFARLDDDITFDGEVGAGDARPLRGRIALMAQSDLLMPWLNVIDNVTLGARLRGGYRDLTRAHDVLDRVGLGDLAHRYPRELSGGQRQRAALARTLMEERPVVLLDEPFSALDALSRARVQDLAAEFLAARTVLHVTHDAAEAARLGDRVLLMTSLGLDDVTVPEAPTPRPYDAPEVLSCQATLLRCLMAAG